MILRHYAAASTIVFPLFDAETGELAKALSFAAGDVVCSLDEAAMGNLAALPVELTLGGVGQGIYKLAVSGAELTGKRLTIAVRDQTEAKTWQDVVLGVETFGHPQALFLDYPITATKRIADDLLKKWLAIYDPIHDGFTLWGVATGVCLTGGFGFPLITGGVLLYRGPASGHEAFAHGLGHLEGPKLETPHLATGIAFDEPVGAAAGVPGEQVAEVTTFPWVEHEAGESYLYCLRSIGAGGVERTDGPTMLMQIDDEGDSVGALPAAPTGLEATPVADGKFRVSWRYSRRKVAPASFKIYGDGGTGTMDWETPLATVDYVGDRRYGWISSAFAHGLTVKFGVRGARADGGQEKNAVTVEATADAEGPAQAEDLEVEMGADE